MIWIFHIKAEDAVVAQSKLYMAIGHMGPHIYHYGCYVSTFVSIMVA